MLVFPFRVRRVREAGAAPGQSGHPGGLGPGGRPEVSGGLAGGAGQAEGRADLQQGEVAGNSSRL